MPKPPSLAKKVRQFFAWSFSRFCDYRECPAKAAYKHIDKLDNTDFRAQEYATDKLTMERLTGKVKTLPANTEPMIKGSVVHALAENFNNGKLKNLPSELSTFKDEFKQLKKFKVINERQWAFDEKWNPVEWFSKSAWLRVMVDAHLQSGPGKFRIIDYKTGKAPTEPGRGTPSWNNAKYYQHEEQREIYAVAVFVMYTDCEEVTAEHWYVDAGVEYKNVYNRKADFERLKTKWAKEVRSMMNDRSFVPKPSPSACKFCSFKNANGGPCKY
jgi:CRISPR/Cas system-associated exonuclease Cas4 (RecB family)